MTGDAVGGVWQYALTLAQALAARAPAPQVEIALAIMGPGPSAAQRLQAAAIPNLRLFESDFRLEWMEGAEADFAASAAWLRRLAERFGPDIIHLNGYGHAAGEWPTPVVVVAHSCVLSWWRAVHGAPAPPEWHSYSRRVADGLAAADRIVAPTAAMLQSLTAHYGALRSGQIIANGCALATFRRGRKEDFVLSAGRLWDAGKNLTALDAAAGSITCPVYVAGDRRHPDGGEVAPRAAQALGPLTRQELADWMARAAIYALPARYEPFGLSVLEAAASGCALVLGDIPSLRESWDSAALFVPPNDPPAIVEAIEALRADQAMRERLAAAAWRRARGFSASRMAQRYAALYHELAPRRAVPTFAGAS